ILIKSVPNHKRSVFLSATSHTRKTLVNIITKMRQYKEFDIIDKQKVIDAVKNINNSKVLIKMNNIRQGDTVIFRLTVENLTTDSTQSDLFFKELLDKL
ncbi:hypothetical protein, partial [Flavobacterium sp.]|uniref:hypothetical protein n=1 Tax=Flavobacterium sp. TaxID=239 RepID=UPI00404800A8